MSKSPDAAWVGVKQPHVMRSRCAYLHRCRRAYSVRHLHGHAVCRPMVLLRHELALGLRFKIPHWACHLAVLLALRSCFNGILSHSTLLQGIK